MFIQAQKRTTGINLWYAKLYCKLASSKRLSAYRKLAVLLRNNFTLMDALSRLETIESQNGKKMDEPFAIAYREWQYGLEKGLSFAEALKGWVPSSEMLMLSVGDISKLQTALLNLIKVNEGTKKITSLLFGALAYPIFLFIMTFIVIIMVGLYLVPPLMEAAGNNIIWHGSARSLVSLSFFAKEYWLFMTLGLFIFIVMIMLSLPFLTGRFRVFLDRLPPWSLYKTFISVSWLLSLSAMIKAGTILPRALKSLADNSSPYLSYTLNECLRHISNGDNLGKALDHTGTEFPNLELIGDLSIYADMPNFDETLERIANDYLDDSVRKIESISTILNSVGILLVSGVIAWVVFGTFEMQDQITASFS